MSFRLLWVLLSQLGTAFVLSSSLQAAEVFSADLVRGWTLDKSLKLGFKAHGLHIVRADDGFPVRAGKLAFRFEVRDGDCSTNNVGYSDCGRQKERHELIEIGRLSQAGDRYWYGWSVYMPLDFPNIHPAKLAMGQFHELLGPSLWLLRNGRGGLHINRQDELGRGYAFEQMLSSEQLRGRWVDIVLHVVWQADHRGRFSVFLDGKPAYVYRGPTLRAGKRVYFKIGLYRFALNGAPRPNGKIPTQIIYYDEIRRGKTRREVEISR